MNWRLFRASYFLFALAIVAPAILVPLVGLFLTQSNFQGRAGGDGQVLMSIIFTGAGPTLFAGAIICGLGSMMPRQLRFAPAVPQSPPPPHPLD